MCSASACGSRSSLTFAVFFVAPVLWLILAPTKSDQALITSSPFSFGDFHHVALAWKHLDAFSDHIYRRWIGNTLYYALSATAITLVVSVPAGYGLAFGKVPRPQAHPLADARRDDHAGGRARAADLPRAEQRASDRERALGDPALLVLPVRRLPRLHLLRDLAPARAARRGAGGRLPASCRRSCGSRCRSRSRSSRSSSSSASSPTGTTSSCRTSSSRTRTSTRSRSASGTCSPRRRRSTRRSAGAASRSRSSSRSSRSRPCSPSCRWRSSSSSRSARSSGVSSAEP